MPRGKRKSVANVPPVSFDILKNDSDGKIFVINEVLNYYQRKLNVLGPSDAKLLAHHVFTPEVVNEARKLLHAIWLWRDLPDIPAHTKVANMLIERRQLRQSNLLLSSDIIDFLQLEDARLKVTFLTLRCEDIPSKVTEQEAMRDVYTLLSKNEYDYNKAIVSLQEQEQAYEQSIRDIRNDMSEGFEAIMAKLNNNNRSGNESVPYHTPSSSETDNTSDILLTYSASSHIWQQWQQQQQH